MGKISIKNNSLQEQCLVWVGLLACSSLSPGTSLTHLIGCSQVNRSMHQQNTHSTFSIKNKKKKRELLKEMGSHPPNLSQFLCLRKRELIKTHKWLL